PAASEPLLNLGRAGRLRHRDRIDRAARRGFEPPADHQGNASAASIRRLLTQRPAVKPEIVIIGPIYPPTQARLEAEFAAHRLWEAPDQLGFLRSVADRVRGVAVYALHGCTAAVIEALPRLEIIACMGIGVDR